MNSRIPAASAVHLVNTLLSSLPDTSPAVIVVKSERPPPQSRPVSAKVDTRRPTYDPGVVFTLELATILTLRDDDTIRELGEVLTASLQNIVRDAKNVHPLTLTRTVNYLLNLLRRSYVCPVRLR
jgi:brefeldin A-resistance guanine nucleotide exchange factor 1